MAYLTYDYCRTCESEDAPFTNGKCNVCSERQRVQAIAAWQAQTVDEKLLDLHKRLLEIEQAPRVSVRC